LYSSNSPQTEAIRNIISERLTSLNLTKVRLPLDAAENSPNVPIFVSSNLKTKKRVIILFYEHTQDLGVFAHRIIGGKGGINAGSAVNMVKYIQSLPDSPGIILANMGQMSWWRRGRKAVTQTSWQALPQKTAVEFPYRLDAEKNTIPGNRNTAEHVNYIFNYVVQELCDQKVKLDVIGVGDGAVKFAEFLEKDENWKKWGGRMEALAVLATFYHAEDNHNNEFADWLQRVWSIPLVMFMQPFLTYNLERKSVPCLSGTMRSIHCWSRRQEVDPCSWLSCLQLGGAILHRDDALEGIQDGR
jgi:hypothetical protein